MWLLQTYWRIKREFTVLFKSPKYAHLDVIQFRSPRETDLWIASLVVVEVANG